MSIRIDFSRLPKIINKSFYPLLTDYRRYQIIKGGAGAGKSWAITEKIIYNTVINKSYNTLVIRKVNATNHDSTFAQLCKVIHIWGLTSLFKINRSKGKEEIVCRINKNKIAFRGLDDPEKIKSITYENGDITLIWIEEASEISEDDFTKLDLRLRGIGRIPKHMILSFNPVDSDHWVKAKFFDNPIRQDEGYVHESTYLDNKYVDKKYMEVLENLKNIDYYLYRVYALGEWGSLTKAKVFENIKIWDFDLSENNMSNIRHGQDFGFIHASALMGTGQYDGQLYIFREAYAKRKTNPQFIKLVEGTDFDKDYPITADSADPKAIAGMHDAGFKIYPTKKGKGSLMNGVNYLKELPIINIHKTKCPNAAREFPKFKYRELKDGTLLEDVVEVDDDTIAGVRYSQEEFFISKGGSKPVFTKGVYGK